MKLTELGKIAIRGAKKNLNERYGGYIENAKAFNNLYGDISKEELGDIVNKVAERDEIEALMILQDAAVGKGLKMIEKIKGLNFNKKASKISKIMKEFENLSDEEKAEFIKNMMNK